MFRNFIFYFTVARFDVYFPTSAVETRMNIVSGGPAESPESWISS